MFLATGEVALRIFYRDAGRATLGGPGGRDFDYLYLEGEARGRLERGPRRPGVRRLLAVGDSITWGQGVRDWREVWPERLLADLQRDSGPHELAVLAQPGRNMAEHALELERWGRRVQPDVLIYQWYVNDVEVLGLRPDNARRWQQWRSHPQLRQWSYLYYFLDNRLSALLPPPDRSYREYVLGDFAPGTMEWSEFERFFHSFATRGKEIASTRLLVLYPQVPFRGAYPLQSMHDRMRALAGPHTLSLPPASWVRLAGVIEPSTDAPWRQVVRVPVGTVGSVIETREYYMGETTFDADVVLRATDGAGDGDVVAIEIVDAVSNQLVDRAVLRLESGGSGWQRRRARLDARGAQGHAVRFRLQCSGASPIAFASIDLAVDYGMHVVDLTEPLNTFNTHASIFDAHPNARAQKVIADEVAAALRGLAAP